MRLSLLSPSLPMLIEYALMYVVRTEEDNGECCVDMRVRVSIIELTTIFFSICSVCMLEDDERSDD